MVSQLCLHTYPQPRPHRAPSLHGCRRPCLLSQVRSQTPAGPELVTEVLLGSRGGRGAGLRHPGEAGGGLTALWLDLVRPPTPRVDTGAPTGRHPDPKGLTAVTAPTASHL